MSLAARYGRALPRSGVLAASLALNAFLVALLAAYLLRPALAPSAPGRGNGPIGRIVDALPDAEASRMRAVLDRARPERDAAREKVAAAQRTVAAAIAKRPYDEAEVRRALDAWQASWQDFATDFDQMLIQALGTLSDDGRARFAAAALAEDARHRHAP